MRLLKRQTKLENFLRSNNIRPAHLGKQMEHASKRMRARLAGLSRLALYRDCLLLPSPGKIHPETRANLRAGWRRFATIRHRRPVRRAAPVTREERWLGVLRTLIAKRRAASPRLPEFLAEVSRCEKQEVEAPAIVHAIRRMRAEQAEAIPREWINPAVAEELGRAAETDAKTARDIRSVIRFRRAREATTARRRRFERTRRRVEALPVPARLRPAARRARLCDRAIRLASIGIEIARRLDESYSDVVYIGVLTAAHVSLATVHRLCDHSERALLVLDHAADIVQAAENAPDRLSLQLYEAGFLYLERARNLAALGLTLEAATYLNAATRVAESYGDPLSIVDEVASLFDSLSLTQVDHC